MADGGEVVMLMDNAQLEELASLLRTKEEHQVWQAVKSEHERAKYLEGVNEAYEHVVSLLRDGAAAREKHAAKGRIAQELRLYINYGLNMGMQNIRNGCLRRDYLAKFRAHYDSILSELDVLEPGDLANVERLTEDVVKFNEAMLEQCKNLRGFKARCISKAYSLMVKEEGITLPELLERTKTKLGLEAPFEELNDVEKLRVYNSIIEESGRANIPALDLAAEATGVAVLLVSAGIMVWDIFTAEHHLEALLEESLRGMVAVGQFAVQVSVDAAVTEALADAELAVWFVSMAGFVAATLVGLAFAAAAGVLLDFILSKGGKQAPPVTHLKFHTTKMPDGMQLAYTIAAYSG